MDSPCPSPSPSTSLLVDSTTRVVHMIKGKVTKNTVRYEASPEDGAAPAVKTVYVEKWSLGATPPEAIDLTLSFSTRSSKK